MQPPCLELPAGGHAPAPYAHDGEAQVAELGATWSQRSPRSVGSAARRRSARPSALGNGYALNPVILIIMLILIIRRPLGGKRRCEVAPSTFARRSQG